MPVRSTSKLRKTQPELRIKNELERERRAHASFEGHIGVIIRTESHEAEEKARGVEHERRFAKGGEVAPSEDQDVALY